MIPIRWPNLNFEPALEQFDPLHVHGRCRSGLQNAYNIGDIGRTYSGDDRPDDRGL
jgi:hypothetical protein